MEKQNFNINASDHPLITAKQSKWWSMGTACSFLLYYLAGLLFYGFYGNLVCNCAACFMSSRIYISAVLHHE